MAFTNGQQPKFVGTLNGALPRIERSLPVDVANVAVGDFVTLSSGVWGVWADTGLIGGIYLGRDGGSITTGGVVIPAPGIDQVGLGVYKGDGPETALADAAKPLGAVLVLDTNTLVEIDIKEGLTMTTVVPGAIVGGIDGATYASASSGGWYFELNATTDVDNLVTVQEILVQPAAALRGRMVVRFHNPALLNPGG